MPTAASQLYQSALFFTPKEQLLRPFVFDFWLIPGVLILSLSAGLLCVGDPALFPIVLFLDLWILGYHHVVSTYTRICFDLGSLKENKFFVFYLPFIVAIPCAALFISIGPWILSTIYLYWQWFHYTRQSYGISRIYARKSEALPQYEEKLTTVAMYSIPLLGILYRSWQAPEYFLGLPVKVLPVSFLVVQTVAALAASVLVLWFHSQWQQYKRGSFSKARFLYLMSHHLVFGVAYIVISSVDIGWLVVNIWHNAQYILIVWLFNNNRFKAGISEAEPFLSTISQSHNWIRYAIVCLGISTLMYLLLRQVTSDYASAVPLAIVIYSVINFHHYVVDGVIWKVRKKAVRQHLVTE